jgi:hypothetical protein
MARWGERRRITPVRRAAALFVTLLALGLAAAPGAAAKARVSASPNPVELGQTVTLKGRGWPVIEFCSRTVRLSLRSDQNAFPIGRDRVGPRGRFRFAWVPRRSEVGPGDWTLVARMRCESGDDGSPNPVRATTPLRIGPANLVVGSGRTSKARWTLLARRARFGGLCLGMQADPPSGRGFSSSGGGCGGGLRGEPLSLGLFYARHRGTFGYGMAAPEVARVEARFGAGEPTEAHLLPSPAALGFAGRFWVAPFAGACMVFSAEAFDAQGTSLGRVEVPEAPPPKPGQPPQQLRRDCPPG